MRILNWLDTELFGVIGWTMIHSLWQCLGLLALLKLVLGVADLRRSAVRYAIAAGVMVVAAGLVAGTFWWEWRRMIGEGGVVAGAAGTGPALGVRGVPATGAGPIGPVLSWLERCCPWLALAWFFGMFFYMGRLAYSGFVLLRLRRSPGLAMPEVAARLSWLQGRMGFGREVRLIVTDGVAEPLTFGLLRSVIVMPLHYVSQAPVDQLDMILAHELAHIRRRDYVVNLFQCVLDGILFFNPFFRRISAAVREEREYCCDDEAAALVGDKQVMALALAQLRLTTAGMRLTLQAMPPRQAFFKRVSRLVDPVDGPRLSLRAVGSWVFLAAVISVGFVRCSHAILGSVALPGDGVPLMQRLWDNQAGYNERVYYYQQGGQNHELFLVNEEGRRLRPVYGYIDGKLLSAADLTKITVLVEKQLQVVQIIGRANEKSVTSIAGQVRAAMARYEEDAKQIPWDVKQHELLTRIVVNRQYTTEDRAEMAELLKGRNSVQVSGVNTVQ
jgi:BlaR1 peptidase M56